MSRARPDVKKMPVPKTIAELHSQISRFDAWFAREAKPPLAFRKFYVRMVMNRNVGVFSLEYVPALAHPDSIEGHSLTAHIYDWYYRTYGHHRLFQVPLQHIALRKRGVTWPLRVSSLGELWLADHHKHVDAAPTAKEFSANHKLCWQGLLTLRALPQVPLVVAMTGDYDSSVYHLLGERVHLGLARWHTMQATEKLLKVFLRANGMSSADLKLIGHDLTECRKQCEVFGLEFSGANRERLKRIQCSPAVRYPDAPPDYSCELSLALSSHYDLLTLAKDIAPTIAAGIKTSSHLGNVGDSSARSEVEHFEFYRLLELEELSRTGRPLVAL